MMMMSVILIFVLRILFIPFALSQSTSGGLSSCYLCRIMGLIMKQDTNYQFSISDLPKRCDNVVVGNYALDPINTNNLTMYKEDEDIIRSLVAAKKSVFTMLTFKKDDKFPCILNPTSDDEYNQLICPLIQKINELKLSGIIIGIFIYTNNYNYTDLPTKISTFATKLKQQIPSLILGLPVFATDDWQSIPDNKKFDFNITNSVIDFYDIEMFSMGFYCDDTMLNNRTLITSNSTEDYSLQNYCNAVAQSSMDKSKTYAEVLVPPLDLKNAEHTAGIVTYSQYCDPSNAGKKCKVCAEVSKMFYEEGAYLKKSVNGIVSSWLDFDDYKGTCECRKYPVTNSIFDGWDGKEETSCDKIDTR